MRISFLRAQDNAQGHPSTCYPYANLPFIVDRWDLKLLARNLRLADLLIFVLCCGKS